MPVLPLSVAAKAYPCDRTKSAIARSFAYWRRVPGEPETTRPPFQWSGRRSTNCESWFHPWLVFVVDVSGK
jgi:hypothetical protein